MSNYTSTFIPPVLYNDTQRYVVSEKGVYNFSKVDQSITTVTEMTGMQHTKSRLATRVINPATNTIYIFGGQQTVTPQLQRWMTCMYRP